MKTYGLTWFGRFAIRLKIIHAWIDGDSSSFVWNYWNPLSYILIVLVILIAIPTNGIGDLINNPWFYGFGLSPYWKDLKETRVFITNRMLKNEPT